VCASECIQARAKIHTTTNVVVAKDGTCNFTTLTAAVFAAHEKSLERYIIHVKKEVYIENVMINQNKINLMMIGDGVDATIITGNLSTTQNNMSTYATTTFSKSIYFLHCLSVLFFFFHLFVFNKNHTTKSNV